MRTLWTRLLALFRRGRLDGELNDEVDFHLAMLEEEFRKSGMDEAAAKVAARREFGGVAQTKEVYREQRGVPWLDVAAKDVRYALRGLRRNPGFTAAAVLSLAIGIGANTAIFSMFHALMMRMLPVAKPSELVVLYRTGGWGRGYASYPLYLEIRKGTDLFQDVMARSGVAKVRFSSGGGDRLEMAQCEFVSGNYFGVLGVAPAIGRVFTDEDNRTPHAHPVAVLSHDFWRSRFGGDPGVLGRTIVVDQQPLTVIGVAASGFRGVEADHHADLWEPAMMYPSNIMEVGMNWVWIMARRRPQVSRNQVQAAMDVLLRQYLTAHYGSHNNAAFRRMAMGQRIEVREGGVGLSMLRDQFGKPLTILMAAVGLVLLAACANVAHLLLARGAARHREIALRFSLGATRARLIRQALTESLLLAIAGGTLGVLFAVWGQRAILRFLPEAAGDPFSSAPEGVVLAFTLAISLLSALLFGLAPALRSTAVDPAEGIRSGPSRTGERQPALRRALVIAQVAFSVVLVVLAGLFGHSLAALRSVDLGFRNQDVIAFTLDFPAAWKSVEMNALRRRLLDGVASLPGVLSVSSGAPGPFRGGSSNGSIRVPGSEATLKEPAWVAMQRAAPGYFRTIGTLVAGREFERTDLKGPVDAASWGPNTIAKSVIVNEAFVRAFLPGETRPLGRTLSFDTSRPQGGDPAYIVGVVPNIAHQGLREKIEPTVYLPIAPEEGYTLLVRAQSPPAALLPAIRREVSRLGPQVALTDPRTIRQKIDDSIFQERMLASLSGVFGALALLLAAIGLYGVVAYGTARRAGEIGIRIALGARRAAVLWMVLRDALLLVALGLIAGLPFSFVAANTVSSILFGTKPADPAAFVSTAGALLAIGLAAAFVPARRAASMDPMQSLRHE